MSSKDDNFSFLQLANLGRRKKPRQDKKYATFNRRMMAATIDSMLLMLMTPIFNRYVPIDTSVVERYRLEGNDSRAVATWMKYVFTDHTFVQSWLDNLLLQGAVLTIFSAICWHFWSATPGKMIMRMKIVDVNTEQPISDKQILLRSFGYFVSGVPFLLGFIWMGIDKKRQGWHDKFAQTAVIALPWFSSQQPKPVAEPTQEPQQETLP